MAKVGYAIVTVILVSGLFSFWQEYRVEQTLPTSEELPGSDHFAFKRLHIGNV